MKHITFLLLILGLLTPVINFAQYFEPEEMAAQNKWKATYFNFGLGLDNDHYGTMSLDHLMAFAKNPEEMYRDLSQFEEEATTVTRGLALYSSVGFSPLNRNTGIYRNDRELQFGFGLHSGKEAMVTYKNEDLDTSIVYCNLQGEYTLEGAYIFKGRWGKRFHWYAGGGLSGGITFGNEMILISGRYFAPGEHPSSQPAEVMNAERFGAKTVYYIRFYVPYGIHYRIGQRWQLGFDWRTGIGVQFIQGTDPNYIQKTGAFILGAKYRFK